MAEIYRIGRTKVESSNVNGFRRMNLTPYMRAPKGIDDMIPLTILERAWGYKYLDKKTLQPLDIDQQRNYRTGLVVFWGHSPIEPMKLELSINDNLNSELNAFDTQDPKKYKAMEICWKSENSLLHRIFNSLGKKETDNIIWEGFLEKNNLWQPLFASQFDDPLNIVKGIYINPDGVFTVEYNRPRGFDYNNWIETDLPAMFGAIYNISCFDYKIG